MKMISILSILVSILLVSPISYSQNNKSTTFKLANVKIASKPLTEVPYKNAIETRIGGKIESYNLKNKNIKLRETYDNAFVSAVHYAYSSHRPLTISPDMIWLLIEQGFAYHLHYYSDSIQTQIVKFKGKKTITIYNIDFIKGSEKSNWAKEISKFSDSIKNYMGNDLHKLLVPEFSTTKFNEKIAYEITMMDAVEKYFDYVDITLCGIPQITLVGTTEDWEKIYNNAQKLKKYGLDQWIDKLEPILQEFILTSQGKINKKFWNSMYKIKSTYNKGLLNGWILIFFPYLNSGTHLTKNKFINEKSDYIDSNMLPQGIGKIYFKWIHLPENKTYDMELYAGFIGIRQDTLSKNLIPEIGWAVRDTNDAKLPINNTSEFAGLDERFTDEYDANQIFIYAQDMPEFPGGSLALNRYINNHLNKKYKKEKQTVFLRIEIKKDGQTGKIEIIKGGSKQLNEEIIRIIKTLPKFKPGSYRAYKVNVWYNFKFTTN